MVSVFGRSMWMFCALVAFLLLGARTISGQTQHHIDGNLGSLYTYFPLVNNAFHDGGKGSMYSTAVFDMGNVNGPSHFLFMDHGAQQARVALVPFAVQDLAMTRGTAVMASAASSPGSFQMRSWNGLQSSPVRQASLNFPGVTTSFGIRSAGTQHRGGEVALFQYGASALETGLGDFGWWVVDDSLQYLYKRSFACGVPNIGLVGGTFLSSGALMFVGTSRFQGTNQAYNLVAKTDSVTLQPNRVVRLRRASGGDLTLNEVRECSAGIVMADNYGRTIVMLDHGLTQVLWAKQLTNTSTRLLGALVEGDGGVLTGRMILTNTVYVPYYPFSFLQNQWGHFGVDMLTGELKYSKYVTTSYGGIAPNMNMPMQPFRLADGHLREMKYFTDNYHSEWNVVRVDTTGFMGCDTRVTQLGLGNESILLDVVTGWTTDNVGTGSLGAVTGSLVSPVHPKSMDLYCDCYRQFTITSTLISQSTYAFGTSIPDYAQITQWDFGDGTQATGANPIHVFLGLGTYIVTACRNFGCATYCETDTVTVTTNCPQPIASFTQSFNGMIGTFNCVGSLGTNLLWQFGDGTTDTVMNPTHFYPGAGTYNACLICSNACGADTFCRTLTLTCPAAPVAAFTYTPAQLTAYFNGNIVTGYVHSWDMGDGTTSVFPHPIHTYAASGTYTVCHIVSTGCAADTVCQQVTVVCPSTGPPFTTVINNNQVNFLGYSGVATGYVWNFGDGTTSQVPSLGHFYTAPGSYTACLYRSNGCRVDTFCQVINVICPPINATFTSATSSLHATFNTAGSIGAETWYYGDGSSGSLAVHDYAVSGTYNVCLIMSNNCATDTFCQMVTVVCVPPTAAFLSSVNQRTVSFTNQNVGCTYVWQFGDGGTSTSGNPIHPYLTDGTYNVCMTATNSCGTSTVCHAVVINCGATPNAIFTSSGTTTTVAFNSAGSVGTSFLWTFGDGGTSTAVNPTYTYAVVGIYPVCLITRNLCDADTACTTLTVSCPLPSASFTQVTSGLTVSLTTTSNAQVINWIFGDGNLGTGLQTSHTYATPGAYTVCLIASNSCGNNFSCVPITVTCPAPIAAFSQTANGLTTNFSNAGSGSGVYSWQFGDGGTSNVANPIHSYASPGTYNVCLSVTNSCGTGTICHAVVVTCPLPVATFSETSSELIASFSSAGSSGTLAWDFGDGTISALPNPVHNYAVSGTYNVCLIASNSCGADTLCMPVTVTCTFPMAALNHANNFLTVAYNSFGSVGSLFWDFGDGTTSSSQSGIVSHTYAAPGIYTACLIASNTCGGDTVCIPVVVFCQLPNAIFTQTSNLLTATFNSSGSTGSWFWLFGDGGTSTLANPVHNYALPGTYNACLITTNSCGSDTSCATVVVTCPLPVATFSQTMNLLMVTFNSGGSTGNDFLWQFGDGGTSALINPFHNYAAAGIYNVCLITTNSCGADTSCAVVVVTCPQPSAAFSFTWSGLSYQFQNQSLGNGALQSLWSFGDGATSSMASPAHTYALPGAYAVCLHIMDTCFTDSTCELLSPLATEDPTGLVVDLFPLPSDGYLVFKLLNKFEPLIEAAVYSVDGKLLWRLGVEEARDQTEFQIDTQVWASGIYILQLRIEDQSFARRFTVLHE